MKLSVAMMVKNEEKCLERCLNSVLEFFPEIIILDTGSTDRTLEIAQKYTRFVYHQSWKDNFALHRNKSFSYATGDWILQIDADEEIIFDDPSLPERFKIFLSKLPAHTNACALLLKDWRDSQNRFFAEHDVVRVFRNGNVRYKRRIHNEPMYQGDAAIVQNGIWIKHYGYDLTPEQEKKKAKRTVGLLELSLKEDPKDYASYFYLVQAYASWKNDSEKALQCAEKYFSFREQMIKDGEKFNPSVFYTAAALCEIKGDMENKLKWLKRGLQYNPGDLDLFWLQMTHGLKTKNPEFIVSGARGFAAAYENYDRKRTVESGKFVFNRKLKSYVAALYYLTAANFEGAVAGYTKLKKVVLPQCDKEIEKEVMKKIKALMDILGIAEIEVTHDEPKDDSADIDHIDKKLPEAHRASALH
jgi:glycosyltransferase involved in cell wall biosynthesis